MEFLAIVGRGVMIIFDTWRTSILLSCLWFSSYACRSWYPKVFLTNSQLWGLNIPNTAYCFIVISCAPAKLCSRIIASNIISVDKLWRFPLAQSFWKMILWRKHTCATMALIHKIESRRYRLYACLESFLSYWLEMRERHLLRHSSDSWVYN